MTTESNEKAQSGPGSPLQAWLVACVKEKGIPQRKLAEDSGLSEKHVSQMMTGAVEGSLSAWSRLLIAADALTIEVTTPPETTPDPGWSPVATTIACDWCGECEWCLNYSPGPQAIRRSDVANPETEKDYTDSLHRWHAQHEEWAKRQSIPSEQLAWCREQIEQAAVAYQAGLDAGLNAGYRMGLTMGMQNGLAAAESRRGDDRD